MIHLCITQCTYWTPLLSVKLPIVLLRFIQRNSKALNCDASKLLRLKYNYPRLVPPKSGSSLGLCVYSLQQSLYILMCECVFPCWTPTELVYLLVELIYPLVLMLDSHRACISSSCVNVCFHAGLPRSLYILCDCVFPCWTPTELVGYMLFCE